MTKPVYFSFLALSQYLGLEVRKPCRCLSFLGERQEENSVAFFFFSEFMLSNWYINPGEWLYFIK